MGTGKVSIVCLIFKMRIYYIWRGSVTPLTFITHFLTLLMKQDIKLTYDGLVLKMCLTFIVFKKKKKKKEKEEKNKRKKLFVLV